MTRIKIQPGDIYSFGNEERGHGRLIVCLSKISLFIVIFKELQTERSASDKVKTPLFYGWTEDTLIFHRRWLLEVKSHPLPNFSYPNYKVQIEGEYWVTDVTGKPQYRASEAEIASLQYKFSRSPIGYEEAFFAYHAGEWNESYDKLLVPVGLRG